MFEVFSVANVLSILCLVPCFFMFYFSNAKTTGGDSTNLLSWMYANASLKTWITIIFFYTIAILPFVYILFPKFKFDIFFFVTFGLLIIFPHIKLNTTNLNDFSSHGLPIPMIALTYYSLLALLDEKFFLKRKLFHTILVILISLGSLNYIGELWYQIKDISKTHEIGLKNNLNSLEDKTDAVNFIAHNPDNSPFFKYLAKNFYH